MYFAFYFLRYAATTGVIIYWKTDQTFVIHRYHHVWFGTYNSCLSIENKHTQCYLLLQQYPESLIHNSDLLNLIPCKLDVISNPFRDKKLSYTKLSYLILERKFNTIYWMMKILQSLISLVQYQIHQPVINLQHRLKQMCWSLISVEKRPSYLKVKLMNSITIKIHMENKM